MKNIIRISLASLSLCASLGGVACAEEASGKWFGHIGPLAVAFDSSAVVKVGGSVVPGGSAKAKDNLTLGFEIGYNFNENISATLTAGIPPQTELTGEGALASAGVLGKATYAPAVLAAQYHFTNFSEKFRPYIGAGVNYTIVLDEKDGFLKNLNVDSHVGSVIQAGFESNIGNGWGWYGDIKKIYLTTDADAIVPAFGNAPAAAKVQLDPLVISIGLTRRF